ncbi:MAG: hypothetical protein GY714_01600 [Desulfobacterales bacterium]|nr:hypothetical protein [Desulfobacterales bacterium]
MEALSRKYEMYIGFIPELVEVKKETDATKKDGTKPEADTKTVPAQGDFILLTDHHFEAQINYPKEGKGNKTVSQNISIFNPAPDTESKIKTGNALLLKAGYNTDAQLPIICATIITKSWIERSGNNRVLKLLCSEAHDVKKTISYSETFAKTLTYEDGINKLLGVFAQYGVPVGRIQITETAKNTQFGKAYSVSGKLSKSMETLCSHTGHRWYVMGGDIYVEPLNPNDVEMVRALQVEQENLKGNIEFLDDITNKDQVQDKTKKQGVAFTINLNGNINREAYVKVVATTGANPSTEEFNSYLGAYAVTSVIHKLSYEGAAWDTIIETRG